MQWDIFAKFCKGDVQNKQFLQKGNFANWQISGINKVEKAQDEERKGKFRSVNDQFCRVLWNLSSQKVCDV